MDTAERSADDSRRLLSGGRLASGWRWLLVWAAVYGVAYVVMSLLPTPGVDYFAVEERSHVYPPWIDLVIWPVRSLTAQNALTLTALAYALWRYGARPVHYVLAFTSMPLYWNLWLGQQDYMPLLGMLWLPWGLPLASLKPQIPAWGVLAWWLNRSDRWRIAAWSVAGLALSFAVYGWWPAQLRLPMTYDTEYNLSVWRWGGILVGVTAVALALVVTLRRRDVDRSMALGALAAPYVQGNSYLLLLPALAHLSGWRLVVVWLTSWAGLAALVFGDAARPLAAIFPLAVWIALERNAKKA